MKLLPFVMLILFCTGAYAQTVVKVLSLTGGDGRPQYEDAVAAKFNAEHPDINVQFERLAPEEFKQKLSTLLQTDSAPHLFYSWGGGILEEQVAAGTTRDISEFVDEAYLSTMSEAGLNAFTIDDVLVGLPQSVSQVVFWYNKDLTTKAGVDPETIKTWDDFLAAVEKIKAAGITPIAVGGADKWPLHFYWSYLAMREAGQEGFGEARSGSGNGFAAESFIKAGEQFARLIALEPFQKGFTTMGYTDASGVFGDGGAAFHLMGDWDYPTQANSAVNGGLSDEQLGLLSFPIVEGGAGLATDTLGGINGYVASDSAPDEAIEFLKYLMNQENQIEAGKRALFIPMTQGSDVGISNPFYAQVTRNLAESQWHQIFLDQDLGADVGGVVNDISLQLATGDIDPQGAAELIQESWELR